MTSLKTLPHTDGPFEAAHIKLSEHALGARVLGPLADAWLVLVVDVGNDMVVGSELVASADAASIAETIVAILLDPAMGVPSVRPVRLLVRDEAARDALVAIAGDAIPQVEVVDNFALLDIAANEIVLSIISRIEVREQPLVDDATTAFFFRSAVSFYNAKPWQLLDDRDTLEITFGTRAPILATVTGASADGLGNIGATMLSAMEVESSDADIDDGETDTDEDALAATGPDSDATPMDFMSLSISIVPEHEAPMAWREVRRLKKWPLASPQAFPMPLATDANGMSRMPNANEMRELSVCLNVIAVTVATKRKEIESGEFRSHEVTVRDDRSVAWTATVRLAAESNDASGDELPTDPRMMPIVEIRDAVMQLPNADHIIERLAWSFFSGDGPGYAENEEDATSAEMRFIDWALFAHRANGQTLAERAVELLAETRSQAELAVHRRALTIRVGEFHVDAMNDDGMTVRDRQRDMTFAIGDAYAAEDYKTGDIIVGMMHEIANDLCVLSPGACLFDEFEWTPALQAASVEHFALTLEAELFGATTQWIQGVPEGALAEVYEVFRETLMATGATLPDFVELQRSVALASAPTQVVSVVSSSIDWWTENELPVMITLVMRTWNVTPRKELNGLSPDADAARRNPPRRAKPGGTRRRR